MSKHIDGGRKAKNSKGVGIGGGGKSAHGDKHTAYHSRRAENRRRGILTAKERRIAKQLELHDEKVANGGLGRRERRRLDARAA